MKYPFVFFDLTDTLIRKSPTFEEASIQALNSAGIYVSMEEMKLANEYAELWIGEQILREQKSGERMPDEVFNRSICQVIEQHIPCPDHAKKAEEILFSLLNTGYKYQYVLIEGVWETLTELKKRGHRMAVVSNNPPKIRFEIKRLKITDFFEEIILSSEVELEKPDPKILNLACQNLGADPAQTIYIGDHPLDVYCANLANIASAWYMEKKTADLEAYNPYQPNYRISSMWELRLIV